MRVGRALKVFFLAYGPQFGLKIRWGPGSLGPSPRSSLCIGISDGIEPADDHFWWNHDRIGTSIKFDNVSRAMTVKKSAEMSAVRSEFLFYLWNTLHSCIIVSVVRGCSGSLVALLRKTPLDMWQSISLKNRRFDEKRATTETTSVGTHKEAKDLPLWRSVWRIFIWIFGLKGDKCFQRGFRDLAIRLRRGPWKLR